MPALPFEKAGPYVVAAYIAFLAVLMIYVLVMAFKLVRMERELKNLHDVVAQRARAHLDEGVAISASERMVTANSEHVKISANERTETSKTPHTETTIAKPEPVAVTASDRD
jgi:hypothetical protein